MSSFKAGTRAQWRREFLVSFSPFKTRAKSFFGVVVHGKVRKAEGLDCIAAQPKHFPEGVTALWPLVGLSEAA